MRRRCGRLLQRAGGRRPRRLCAARPAARDPRRRLLRQGRRLRLPRPRVRLPLLPPLLVPWRRLLLVVLAGPRLALLHPRGGARGALLAGHRPAQLLRQARGPAEGLLRLRGAPCGRGAAVRLLLVVVGRRHRRRLLLLEGAGPRGRGRGATQRLRIGPKRVGRRLRGALRGVGSRGRSCGWGRSSPPLLGGAPLGRAARAASPGAASHRLALVLGTDVVQIGEQIIVDIVTVHPGGFRSVLREIERYAYLLNHFNW
jgi:hypothetical protein